MSKTPKRTHLERQMYRNLASARFQALGSQGWIWRTYGEPLVQHPMAEWRQRLEQDVPPDFRAAIRRQLIVEYGEGLAL